MTQPTTAEDALRLATILARVQTLAEAINDDPEAFHTAILTTEVGQKFIRIVQTNSYGGNVGGSHVHAFVDRSNGDLIKAGGYKAPAKVKGGFAVRGNLVDDTDFARILSIADRHGSYLYADARGTVKRTVTVTDGVYAFAATDLRNVPR